MLVSAMQTLEPVHPVSVAADASMFDEPSYASKALSMTDAKQPASLQGMIQQQQHRVLSLCQCNAYLHKGLIPSPNDAQSCNCFDSWALDSSCKRTKRLAAAMLSCQLIACQALLGATLRYLFLYMLWYSVAMFLALQPESFAPKPLLHTGITGVRTRNQLKRKAEASAARFSFHNTVAGARENEDPRELQQPTTKKVWHYLLVKRRCTSHNVQCMCNMYDLVCSMVCCFCAFR